MIRFFIILCLCCALDLFGEVRAEAVNASLKTLGAGNAGMEDREIASLLRAHQSHLPALVKRYEATHDLYKRVESKFIEAGIPVFFALIPYSESKFNPSARGYRTAGLWQFNKQSARNFGLTVTKKMDERLDVDRSTDAAIRYIKSLKKQFGSWYLADLAYAMGEGTLQRIIRNNKSDDLLILLHDSHFPSGTKAHFAKTLLLQAAVHPDTAGAAEPPQ